MEAHAADGLVLSLLSPLVGVFGAESILNEHVSGQIRKIDLDDLKQNENEASLDRPGHEHLIEKPERTASPEDGNSFIIHPVF